jgi:hypothetical protein
MALDMPTFWAKVLLMQDKPPDYRGKNLQKFREAIYSHDQFNLLASRHYRMIKDLERRVAAIERQGLTPPLALDEYDHGNGD